MITNVTKFQQDGNRVILFSEIDVMGRTNDDLKKMLGEALSVAHPLYVSSPSWFTLELGPTPQSPGHLRWYKPSVVKLYETKLIVQSQTFVPMSTSSRPITHSPAPESQVVTPVRMPSIFGYTRVSCKSQVAGLSLPKQREAVMTYARQCNMPVAEIFEDAGLSGMKIEKQTALGYAKNAAIRGDKLVVTETNRLTHDTLGGLLLLEELKKKGVELVILDLPFPLDSVKGRYYFINELNISEQETSRGSQRASDFYNYARTGKVELTSKIETLSIDVDPQGVSLNEC